MTNHDQFMTRCLEIARLGAGQVSPNPLVGCVIVHNGKILGEGYHYRYGGAHAEVNAIQSVRQKELLSESTLYVNLEPCAHHGKTPPCSDLILESQIPHVVIGTTDPFAKVAGRGIEKLQRGNVKVETGIMYNECRWLNRRFFTFHAEKRPYIILKWAQTPDGFIDIQRSVHQKQQPTWISGELARRYVHKIRSEEDSILIGKNTALKDNPALTVRDWSGKSPVRLVIDRRAELPGNLQIFDHAARTILFTETQKRQKNDIEFHLLDFGGNVVQQILTHLHTIEIQSVIVEGGSYTLQQFIKNDAWDEAHLFVGEKLFFEGVKAPSISGKIIAHETLGDTKLTVLLNDNNHYRF
jgi:diaminohydroxyphosphoribosylaminopyrimidine deaminase/5-amino-6-(5-phosphoribosylamino)uracil reductase